MRHLEGLHRATAMIEPSFVVRDSLARASCTVIVGPFEFLVIALPPGVARSLKTIRFCMRSYEFPDPNFVACKGGPRNYAVMLKLTYDDSGMYVHS